MDGRELGAENVEREGIVPSRDDVLALPSRQPLAVGLVVAGQGVPREEHPRPRAVVEIPEDHGLNGDRRPAVVRQPAVPSVGDRTG
jgi:hypothetical protein